MLPGLSSLLPAQWQASAPERGGVEARARRRLTEKVADQRLRVAVVPGSVSQVLSQSEKQ